MATQITAYLPTLDFPLEADYPTQEDWAAFSAAAELNFGILGGSWSTQMQLWKNQANAMSIELNNNSTIAQSVANYQGDWTSKGYTLGQSVSVSGVYYICKLTHATGQNPTAGGSLYWNLVIGNWALKADKTEVALKADKTEVALKVDNNMSAYTTKTTPVDADLIPLSDSAASFGIKKLTWASLKATLLTYFDTLYSRTSTIFGIGQTRQNVTASRSFGVTYTNTSSKPILIEINIHVGGAGGGIPIISINVNGGGYTQILTNSNANSFSTTYTTIILSGQTYALQNTFGGVINDIQYWVELR